MKKYSWLAILVFAMVLITCVVIASKSEAVRDVFMKSASDMNYYALKLSEEAEKIIFCNI